MKKPGNTKDKIDHDLLHDYLWKRSDRLNQMTISTGELADSLGVTIYSMSRIIGDMIKAGRLRRIGSKIEVIDPELYMWTHTHLDASGESKST